MVMLEGDTTWRTRKPPSISLKC